MRRQDMEPMRDDRLQEIVLVQVKRATGVSYSAEVAMDVDFDRMRDMRTERMVARLFAHETHHVSESYHHPEGALDYVKSRLPLRWQRGWLRPKMKTVVLVMKYYTLYVSPKHAQDHLNDMNEQA